MYNAQVAVIAAAMNGASQRAADIKPRAQAYFEWLELQAQDTAIHVGDAQAALLAACSSYPTGSIPPSATVTAQAAALVAIITAVDGYPGSGEGGTVISEPHITSAAVKAMVHSVAGTFTVTTTGSPAPTLTKTGALPTGVTFVDNSDGTATLAGTPGGGTAGVYPLVITAHNSTGDDAVQNFVLTVT